MKVKKLLKFYFDAQRAVDGLDRLILKRAASPDYCRTALACAERVIELIEKKQAVCSLWHYLDGVMGTFNGEEKEILKGYAFSCRAAESRAARSMAVKFTRRARAGIARHGRGIEVVKEYYYMC
ncbi:MAG: hypothetical protein LUF82_03320 [Clostridia bacterium]|nr:hypothetical protein [Clostridia bacterium]